MTDIKCAECRGIGTIRAMFPVYGPDHQGERLPFVDITCPRCNGSCVMPALHREWITAGRELREKRLHRSMTLRKESARRGISVSELSSMEQGRIEPVFSEE